MDTREPQYLSITISAVCDFCGRQTDNAESEGWTTRDYSEFQCPECQEQAQDGEARLRDLFGIAE